MLVYFKATGVIEHKYFYDLPTILPANVALVANSSKVFMARTFAQKVEGSSEVEILFVRNNEGNKWETLIKPGRRVHVGQSVKLADGSLATLLSKKDGLCILDWQQDNPEKFFDQYGRLPLPPYLAGSKAEKKDYQTVYANQIGSSAAPTAGLHFTKELWPKLTKSHPSFEVCLHVGLGTFKPIQEPDIRNHVIHEEYIEMSDQVARGLNEWKKGGNKICAIGTTSLRTLESCFDAGNFHQYKGLTKMYLYPGKNVQAADMLITNFHTPESSLLVLVASIIGLDELKRVYGEAIKEKYRFFSFGDAMLIL